MFITIIGRGHGGTRAISSTLSESGVFMGTPLNDSADLIPPEKMYAACRIIGKHVTHNGGLSWDFSKVHTMPIPQEFTDLVHDYLHSVLESDAPRKGWKLPETTLAFPWIVRMFPDNYYIHWIRDPRDAVLGAHVTDDLREFNIDYPETDDEIEQRFISWKYQIEIIKSTPKPKHWIEIRFEEFVQQQDRVLEMLESYLGFTPAKIPVKPEAVGRWLRTDCPPDYRLVEADLRDMKYVDCP